MDAKERCRRKTDIQEAEVKAHQPLILNEEELHLTNLAQIFILQTLMRYRDEKGDINCLGMGNSLDLNAHRHGLDP